MITPVTPNEQYKYKLNEWLFKLKSDAEARKVRLQLIELCGITSHTFKKWRYIKASDKHEIPARAMYIICSYFEEDMTEFFTIPNPVISYYELNSNV